MVSVERMKNMAAKSEFLVHSLSVKDEMFEACDLLITVEVLCDQHPEPPQQMGIFRTELFRLSAPRSSPVSYKRTAWKQSDGSPILIPLELLATLDLELRSFLEKRFNAELYDLSVLQLPIAKALGAPWWKRLLIWLRGKRNE